MHSESACAPIKRPRDHPYDATDCASFVQFVKFVANLPFLLSTLARQAAQADALRTDYSVPCRAAAIPSAQAVMASQSR